jgi:hypothetical protein
MHRFLFLLSIVLGTASGQWSGHATAGLPRTPDGRPNLSAPAPQAADHHPDLSGVWRLDFGANVFDVAKDLDPGDVRPWAEQIHQQRLVTPGKDRWTMMCLPGGPALGLDRQIAKIVQTPQLILILYEDLTYRQIFIDGRQLPNDPNPTWMGYSVGRWESDTLVVESAGFNDRTWLDYGGHPHTEGLSITERYNRVDAGHMALEITYTDRQAYAKSWTVRGKLSLAADAELIEFVCAENEKDRAHVVDGSKIVMVPSEVLSKYVGNYEIILPGGRTPVLMPVTLSGTQLMIDLFGDGGKFLLKPLSESIFSGSPGMVIQFVLDARGEVTHLIVSSIEGDITAVHKE